MPDPDRPSPFPTSDSEADIAAKIAELRAFFGISERHTRNIVATAQQRALIERLEARHAARLAGIWVDNARGWNVVVRLTGAAPEADETHPGADGPQRVHYITGAAMTEAEMRRRLHAQRDGLLAQLPDLFGYSLDVKTGELEVELRDTPANRATAATVRDHLQALLGYPVRLRWYPAATRWNPP
ncbi:hypothetical protein [Stenotrophomonas sepilia]|uniref:hypothetical protein n=1 Tax=Stenotrophomonas sepilia TaxID=2860290 RepID=UPI0033426AA5